MNRRFAQAVLSSFRDDAAAQAARTLASTSSAEWDRGLRWLDESGLALYFLARLQAAGTSHVVPEYVFNRLSQNLADNREQSAELLCEFASINGAFHDLSLRYAMLKGFALVPDYCIDSTLRCQFDFDFLIDRSVAKSFADALRALGYQCIHSGETSWEFKKDTFRLPDVRNLYKPKPQKSVELHFRLGNPQSEEDPAGDALGRIEDRSLFELRFPALSSADAFVYQSLHLFKHVRSEWTRVSWLLEFRNFVSAHRNDESFWTEVHDRSRQQREHVLAIGTVTLLATMAFGDFAPSMLTHWTICDLPLSVRRWIERYGWSILLADFPGSKLYLLLQRELMEEQEWRQLCHSRLLPFHRAPAVTQQARNGQELAHFDQLRFSALRLRFHCVEGLRYLIEAARWKRIRVAASSQALKARVERAAEANVITRS